MKKGRKYSEREIRKIAKTAIGKTFNDIKKNTHVSFDESKIQKGSLGSIIEESLYGIEPNGESAPDFIDAGIELKVTPYKKNKDNTLSAKERLVLNQIDYNKEYNKSFKESHFWYKNNKIELMWYLYEDNIDKYDYRITNEILLNLAMSEDLKQIEKDFYYITNKIREGKAHELSEADTMYLGACTKGVNADDKRSQPFNSIQAKRRAFCFKASYMTQLVRKYIGDYSNVESLLGESKKNFEEYVNEKIKKYIGMSRRELMKLFKIDSLSKSLNNIIISKMFNVSNISDTEEFLKAKIIPKTVRIEKNGKIKESMSFPYFKYNELINQTWESSELKEELETTKYMFFIFKKENDEYIFKGIKLWNMPETDIESFVMDMWKKTYDSIKNGNIVKEIKDGYRYTNFVAKKDNPVCHVRPHARNANDTCALPVRDKLTGESEFTKHSFWINNSYIEKVLEEFI